ncbi:DUF4823 domain-containing protein [Gallaecimonas pentaromativorans]|uniref:DUF4823 domain-containing protein n=1 Tax=Gallaecimonas pentaromativorans TaxID=584787 RepID=UPI003A8D0C02
MNRNFVALLVVAGSLFLSACASTKYNVDEINGSTLAKDQRVSLKDANLYLVNGGDGMQTTYLSMGEADEVAKDSGADVVRIENDAFSTLTAHVIAEKNVLPEDKALEVGGLNKSDYLIYSRVEKWSDPLGMNCQKYHADEASVLLSLYSVKDKTLINTSRLQARSCPDTLNGIPLQTGSPEKLYKVLFSQWISKNFK